MLNSVSYYSKRQTTMMTTSHLEFFSLKNRIYFQSLFPVTYNIRVGLQSNYIVAEEWQYFSWSDCLSDLKCN